MNIFRMVFVVAVLAGLTPWTVQAAEITISGDAFYRERIALPDNATLVVQMIDAAKAGDPEGVLGEVAVHPTGQVPIAFALTVASDKMAAALAHGLVARIDVDGATWFATAAHLPFDQTKAAGPVSLLLTRAQDKAASGDAATASPLAGTTWRLVAIDGNDADANVTTTLIFNADGSVSGNGGCNSFGGAITIDATTLKFGDLFSTMMACDEVEAKQENAFHTALSRTQSYKLEAGELKLLDNTGEVVARLAATP